MEGTMRLVANLFAALLVLLTAQAGSAQSNYPNRPVKILVGFTPGTAPDLAARILADRFSESGARRSWSRTFPAPAATSPPIASPRRPPMVHAADGRQLGARHQSEPL
jgi:hypothetical protein